MLIKTILNKTYPVKGFVYGKVSLENDVIVVEVTARKNTQAICSCCYQPFPTYDHLKERRFKFIPLWGFSVELCYRPRRVQCPQCGVKIEKIPWPMAKALFASRLNYSWLIGPNYYLAKKFLSNSMFLGEMYSNRFNMLLITD